jgi:serine/threonine protein kinase
LNTEPGKQTAIGTVLGTPKYISPEQCDGREGLTGKADVYSLGVIMYEMLAGAAPFHAKAGMAYMRQHMTAVPPPLQERAPHVPKELHDLIHSMLAKDQQERPEMVQVVEALRQLRDGSRSRTSVMPVAPSARQRWVLRLGGASLVLILVFGILGVLWPRVRKPISTPQAPTGQPNDGSLAGSPDLTAAPTSPSDLGAPPDKRARSAGEPAESPPTPVKQSPTRPAHSDSRRHGGKHGGKKGRSHSSHSQGGHSSHGKKKE